MGRESRRRTTTPAVATPAVAAPVVTTLESAAYWKLRATIGDVDRAAVEVEKANARLRELISARTALLGEAVPGVDLNFLSHVDWDDRTCQLTLYGVVERTGLSTGAVT